MTRYTVVWLESAIDDLARFWIKTTYQQSLADSADLADDYLATDAHVKGEVLAEGLRALTVGMLRIYFTVREHDRVVEVAYVKRIVRGP
jgi:hypothetical protein